MPIVDIRDLTKSYPAPGKGGGRVSVVNGISFSIERGEVFGILGPNGAGKTTTLEIVEALRDMDSGRRRDRRHFGRRRSNGGQTAHRRTAAGIRVFRLSPRSASCCSLFGALYKRHIAPDEILDLVQLTGKRDARPKQLSGGQRQRFFHRPGARQRSGGVVPRRADDGSRPAGAAQSLGSGAPHPRARQDDRFDHPLHGRSRGTVFARRHHGCGQDHRPSTRRRT